MLFNSIDFAVFFFIVFVLYWAVFGSSLKRQNVFLFGVSLLFYASWDWRFLFLLVFSIVSNFAIGRWIEAEMASRAKYRAVCFGVVINLLLLGCFKYFDFFLESFSVAFSLFGSKFNASSLSLILPLGISFYTFQNISYLVDVYRDKMKAEQDFVSFAVYVSFFLSLISGPIQRATAMLPQIAVRRQFDYARSVDGLRMVLLGLFEKMVIADNCAFIVDGIYGDYQSQSGSTLFFAAILFSFQIYGDFSGYSHIAIGCARLLGFDLSPNFNYPYLAQNIADFWRRWHISFSSWLRDYVYFPLGGNRGSQLQFIRNLFVVFLITGIWHGARLNFVVYGIVHALLYIFYVYYKKWFGHMGSSASRTVAFINAGISGLFTFIVLTLARVFFRTATVSEAMDHFRIIFSKTLFVRPDLPLRYLVLLAVFLLLEFLQRNRKHLLDISFVGSRPMRYSIYFVMIFAVFYYSADANSFIYFQF